MASLSHQISLVPTQENTPLFRNETSSLGPITSPKVKILKGCFWTPSFLDPDPHVNLDLGFEFVCKAMPQQCPTDLELPDIPLPRSWSRMGICRPSWSRFSLNECRSRIMPISYQGPPNWHHGFSSVMQS